MTSSFKPNFQRAFDFSKINFEPQESRWYPDMKAARAGYRAKYPSLTPSPEPSSPSDIDGASVIVSDVASTLSEVSTLTTVPTFDTDLSKKAQLGEPNQFEQSKFDYREVEWDRLPGHTIPLQRLTGGLRSWIWQFGVPTEETETGSRWWLCMKCHKADPVFRAQHNYHYMVDKGSSNASDHLHQVHRLGWNKKTKSVEQYAGKGLLPLVSLDAYRSAEQATLNELAIAFDEVHFRKLLTRWIVYDNVSFRQVDSEVFRDFITYLSPRAGVALPCGRTVRNWIMQGYQIHKATVKNALHNAISKIHIAFDLWTSGNCLSLNGVTAHFLDANFKTQSILLSSPEQSESHYGVDIADQVITVIEDFDIASKLGFFVLDNALNNDTAMEAIGARFGFKPKERRLRCAGHIINLIARHLLFGFDKKLFEFEDAILANMRDELKRWRRTGPVGRAHNLIVWTYSSPSRRNRWHNKQRQYFEQIVDKDEWHTIKTRELHRSNDTRWNSVYDEIKTLLPLRAPFDDFIQSEREAALKKKTKKHDNDPDAARNAIIQDTLSEEDWAILAQYAKLLEPCWEATMDLQGRPGDGKTCGLFNVMPDLECIVEHLTEAYNSYKDAPAATTEGQWHFRNQIKLALDKAEEYYAKLDDSPAYLAATVLHPSYTWRFIEQRWARKKSWVSSGKKSVKSLYGLQYKKQVVSEAISPQKQREPNKIVAHRRQHLDKVHSDARKATPQDEFERFCDQAIIDVNDCPIQWWRTIGLKEYPHLAQMAFDMLSIPAMSDEPERVFSHMGLMVTKRRNHLEQDTIQAAQCLYSWDRASIIDMMASDPAM